MGKTITALLSSKRRKVSDDRTPYRNSSSTLSKLPKEPLSHVSSFLAAPSRALFAVALDLDTQDMSLFSDFRSAILGDDWGTLDFGEIEKGLAAKLCDEDVEAALVFIEASANVKRLKLTNCINITGSGLWPLRGSTIIEQIDLSIVRNGMPQLDIDPSISHDVVLPILDSIINRREECSLKQLQLPSVWIMTGVSWKDPVNSFLERYQSVFVQSFAVCRNMLVPQRRHPPNPRFRLPWLDTLKNSCYECLEIYCLTCSMLRECNVCDKQYCTDCVKMERCPFCNRFTCAECLSDTSSCSGCNVMMCKMCYYECNEQDSSQTRQLRQIQAHPGSASDLFGDSDSSDSESGGIDQQISAFHRKHSCYKCLKISCNGCRNGVADDGRRAFQRCGSCKMQFCNDCVKMETCPSCENVACAACLSDNNTCPGCSERVCKRCFNSKQCSSCEKQFCSRCSQIDSCDWCCDDICVECLPDGDSCHYCDRNNKMCESCPSRQCPNCNKGACEECFDDFWHCSSCNEDFCEECSQKNKCPLCNRNEITELKRMRDEIVELKRMNEELNRENEELKRENDELKGQTKNKA
ncbi:hypothetical protein ACHAWC_010260 [Mediolabrus comicus]